MLVFCRRIQNRTSRTFAKFHCPHQSYPAGHSLPFLADFLNRSYWIVNTFHEKTIFVLDLAIMRNKSESEKDDEKENQIDKIMLRTAEKKRPIVGLSYRTKVNIVVCYEYTICSMMMIWVALRESGRYFLFSFSSST